MHHILQHPQQHGAGQQKECLFLLATHRPQLGILLLCVLSGNANAALRRRRCQDDQEIGDCQDDQQPRQHGRQPGEPGDGRLTGRGQRAIQGVCKNAAAHKCRRGDAKADKRRHKEAAALSAPRGVQHGIRHFLCQRRTQHRLGRIAGDQRRAQCAYHQQRQRLPRKIGREYANHPQCDPVKKPRFCNGGR